MQSRLFWSVLFVMVVSLVACVPIEEGPSDRQQADSHYMLGVSNLNEQNPTGALKEFLEAEKYDDRDDRIQAGLAQAYWLKNAYDLSEKHFLRAIELSDNDPKYYNNLAALYLTMERYDDAIKAFRKAADNLLFDRPELAWTGIGLANVEKQDYVAAQRAYLKAINLNSRYYLATYRLGELYYNQDRPVEALDMFTRTVELAPQLVEGHYWQGLVYMKMKETEKAKQSFNEVIRLAPQSETARLAGKYLKIINE
jgi:tetratricopeptide (TPR) repeat protein